jgi:hypothetical protein
MNQDRIIIGLGSKARIGKDYAAIKLAKYFNVQRVSFADVLKDDLSTLFKKHNLSLEALLADPDMKEVVRPLLIAYGQTMRKFDENVWLNAAIKNADFSNKVTIFTDVRFPNEAEAIQAIGGYYVNIISDVAPSSKEEALYSPILEEMADFHITNNFDDQYIEDMKSLIYSLLSKKTS